MRKFDTGATRNLDNDKLDFEGFLNPIVIERYAQYLHKHRLQADGKMRTSDNWQQGIPKDVYMKSMFRHFMEVWKYHRGYKAIDTQESLCGLLFNVMGYLFEEIRKDKGLIDRERIRESGKGDK
jgi:hypothetical protein